MLALSDAGVWRKWLEIRPSCVDLVASEGQSAGIGVYAARTFAADDVVSQFLGETTTSASKKAQWLKTWRKHYAMKRADGRTLVCPKTRDIHGLLAAGHMFNHTKRPNCVVGHDLVIRTKRVVQVGEELTIDYNR